MALSEKEKCRRARVGICEIKDKNLPFFRKKKEI